MSSALLGATLGDLIRVGSGTALGVFTGTLMLNGTWTGAFVPNDIGDLMIGTVGPIKIDGERELLDEGTTGAMALLGDFVGSFVLIFRVDFVGENDGADEGGLIGAFVGDFEGALIGDFVEADFGAFEGTLVDTAGAPVGVFEEALVGDLVETDIGAFDGALVGDLIGAF